jgi:hypothetical protein
LIGTIVSIAIVVALGVLALWSRARYYDHAGRPGLWERAPRDLAAAAELRRRLLKDAEADAEILQKSTAIGSPDLADTLARSRETHEQIARLDDLISKLRAGS